MKTARPVSREFVGDGPAVVFTRSSNWALTAARAYQAAGRTVVWMADYDAAIPDATLPLRFSLIEHVTGRDGAARVAKVLSKAWARSRLNFGRTKHEQKVIDTARELVERMLHKGAKAHMSMRDIATVDFARTSMSKDDGAHKRAPEVAACAAHLLSSWAILESSHSTSTSYQLSIDTLLGESRCDRVW